VCLIISLNPFDSVLGVGSQATADEIRKAYLKLEREREREYLSRQCSGGRWQEIDNAM
jgi:DnaJ-class molecular chaperone